MRRLAVTVALAVVMSGCAQGGGGGDDDGVDAVAGLDLQATETTGVIRGVVVDEAIRPLAGVAVRVETGDEPLLAETTESGVFGFDGLDPGVYFVTASRLGYESSRQSVDVVAGESEPPAVKILLLRIPGFVAFVEQYKWDGYMECGLHFVIACAGPNAGSQIACAVSKGQPPIGPPTPPSPVPVCLGNVTNDEFSIWHGVQSNLTLIQSEMVWDSTQALGDTLSLLLRYGSLDDFNAGFYNGSLNSSSGRSPVTAKATLEDMEDTDLGIHNGLVLAVFPGRSPTLANQAGATVAQTWTTFTHAFHGYLPPPDWTFVGSGGVVPQPA